MKSVSRLAVVGLFAFTAAALAEDSLAPSSTIHVIARADLESGSDSVSLDEYAGRYELANGDIVVVFQDGDTLAVELPESSGLAPMQLNEIARYTFATDTDVVVTFETDTYGRIDRLTAFAAGVQLSVGAVKTPSRRGFVTIHDLDTTDAPVRRGLVTIHDIDPPMVQSAGTGVLALTFNP
jgi:Domain of unknown function (DUF3471)